MNRQQIEALITRALFAVAPDLEGVEIDAGEPFREQFEIDSMDFLNFVVGLGKATGLDIPEADYPRLQTLDDCVAYLQKRMTA
jgi:acyl carrier protein